MHLVGLIYETIQGCSSTKYKRRDCSLLYPVIYPFDHEWFRKCWWNIGFSDKWTSLQNSSCGNEPVQPMRSNWHTTTPHNRMQRREGPMGLESRTPSNNPSHKQTSSSSWMAAQITLSHLASTAARVYPMDSCTLSILSQPTLPPTNPSGLCGCTRRARWKAYRLPLRLKRVGNYLTIIAPPVPS